jgi:hypothetical protein
MLAKAFLAAVCAAMLTAPLSGAASVSYQLSDAALAARIDGHALHAFSVDTVWRQARARTPEASRSATLETLVAERLLAAHARASHGGALESGLAVAFAPEVALDDRLAATLREVHGKDIEQALQRLPGGTLDGLVLEQPTLDAAAWEQLLGKPGQLRLEISLTAAQQARAAQMVLLRYRLPAGPVATITLLDVYRRQNVQGRVALLQPGGFALQQARQALGVLWLQHWAKGQFGAAALDDLRQVLADQETVLALQRLHGIGADTDAGSSLLDKLAAQTTPTQVQAYYLRHKDQFTRIERVKARHLQLADEAQAQAAYRALQAGEDFAALARKLSRARDAAQGGSLGWVRAQAKPDWLSNMVFAQPPGPPSRPIRAPVGPDDPAYWEIVLVEQVEQGYHPADSETVRYIASRALARETALAQLTAQRSKLLRAAHIDINRRLLDQPLRSLEPA